MEIYGDLKWLELTQNDMEMKPKLWIEMEVDQDSHSNELYWSIYMMQAQDKDWEKGCGTRLMIQVIRRWKSRNPKGICLMILRWFGRVCSALEWKVQQPTLLMVTVSSVCSGVGSGDCSHAWKVQAKYVDSTESILASYS